MRPRPTIRVGAYDCTPRDRRAPVPPAPSRSPAPAVSWVRTTDLVGTPLVGALPTQRRRTEAGYEMRMRAEGESIYLQGTLPVVPATNTVGAANPPYPPISTQDPRKRRTKLSNAGPAKHTRRIRSVLLHRKQSNAALGRAVLGPRKSLPCHPTGPDPSAASCGSRPDDGQSSRSRPFRLGYTFIFQMQSMGNWRVAHAARTHPLPGPPALLPAREAP